MMTNTVFETQACFKIASIAVQRYEGQAADLIEVRTADGLIGHGEGAWCEGLLRREPELVVGRSAFEVESIFEDLAASGETPGGLDIALWDLIGKALDMPVSRILGKTYRASVRVCGSFPRRKRLRLPQVFRCRSTRWCAIWFRTNGWTLPCRMWPAAG